MLFVFLARQHLHDANLGLPRGVSHPKEEWLEFAAAYFQRRKEPQSLAQVLGFSPHAQPAASRLCLLMNIPWWDKHVSNQPYDVAAQRTPWPGRWFMLVPPARNMCQIPEGSSIPTSAACPSGDTGSGAKGLSGINHSAVSTAGFLLPKLQQAEDKVSNRM